jgi:hypothetical protein
MFEYFRTLGSLPVGSEGEVMDKITRFGMPVDNVVFLSGDVKETTAAVRDPIAMLLVDVDFYEPTRATLENLHPLVSSQGTVYIDDYYVVEYGCRRAVDDYFKCNELNPEIKNVNKFALSWIV